MFKVSVGKERANASGFLCRENESLLDAARQQGFSISYACKGGGCGLCKIKIESGDYERKTCSSEVLPDKERLLGYTLACKTYPKSDLNIVIHLSESIS